MPPRTLSFLGLLCVALVACGNVAVKRTPVTTSASVQPDIDVAEFVPPGFELLRVVRGDLNADGRKDALVIATRDASDPQALFVPRAVSIVLSCAGGGYELSARNTTLAACGGCGGRFGDGLVETSIKDGAMVIVNEGGSATVRFGRNVGTSERFLLPK